MVNKEETAQEIIKIKHGDISVKYQSECFNCTLGKRCRAAMWFSEDMVFRNCRLAA